MANREVLINSSNREMVSNIALCLTQLLSPNNEAIAKATASLKQISMSPMFLPSLFTVVASDERSEIRKLASVVFRRKISKKWKMLSADECVGIRQAILEQLHNESEPLVAQSLCQIIGEIAKHELSKPESWPDLFAVIQQTVESSEARSFEMGLFLTSVVCDNATEDLSEHFLAILTLLSNSLNKICGAVDSITEDQINSVANSMSYAISAFNSIVPYLGSDHMQAVRSLVLLCVQATQYLLVHDESLAGDSIEVFESLIEAEVAFIAPFVKDLVGFALQVGSNTELEDATRVRCLSLLRWIISLKKKSIIKLGLIGPILDIVYPLTTQPCGDEDENFTTDDNESQSPVSAGLNVIDELALHLPPEKLYEQLLPRIKSSIATNNECEFRGAILAIACITEGTAEHIKNNYLKEFLELVCRSAMHDNIIVRNASLFAIGQFSEYLQPDISEYTSELMPLLFKILNKTPEDKETALTKAYYAMENFIENLDEEKISPYIDPLTQHLLTTLKTSNSIHSKELAISSIGALANAAKEQLLPYMEEILILMKSCLPEDGQSEEVRDKLNLLHTQTLDTLAVLARTVGKTHFAPLADDCIKLGLKLLEEDSDPDMRRATYGLFSAMSTVIEHQMAPYLPTIVKFLTDSVASVEGVVAHLSEEGEANSSLSFLDETEISDVDITSSQDDDDEEDLDGLEGFSVENAYIDEKADACEVLGEISKHTAFADYFEISFTEVFKVADFPHQDVRKYSILACADLITSAYKQKHPMCGQFISTAFPLICETIVKDSERTVVMSSLNAINEIVKECGNNAFPNGEESLKILMESIVMVMQERAACQDNDDEDGEDQQHAEHDEMVHEFCGDLLPSIAGAVGTALFLPLFKACMPTLLGKLKSTSTIAESSFASGTIAETFEKLGTGSAEGIVDAVIPKLLQATKHSHDEVRNNSVFAIGVVLMNGGASAEKHYPTALQCLYGGLGKEKSRRVVDNVLGAVSRLLISNKSAVPLKEVLPVYLKTLPIVEDHEEDEIVYACLAQLMHDENICDAPMQKHIIEIYSSGLLNKDVKEDVRVTLAKELKNMSKSPIVVEVLNSLPSDKSSEILQLVQAV